MSRTPGTFTVYIPVSISATRTRNLPNLNVELDFFHVLDLNRTATSRPIRISVVYFPLLANISNVLLRPTTALW